MAGAACAGFKGVANPLSADGAFADSRLFLLRTSASSSPNEEKGFSISP
jgi:hypothetical protein